MLCFNKYNNFKQGHWLHVIKVYLFITNSNFGFFNEYKTRITFAYKLLCETIFHRHSYELVPFLRFETQKVYKKFSRS